MKETKTKWNPAGVEKHSTKAFIAPRRQKDCEMVSKVEFAIRIDPGMYKSNWHVLNVMLADGQRVDPEAKMLRLANIVLKSPLDGHADTSHW
jgi:hypothetical protein